MTRIRRIALAALLTTAGLVPGTAKAGSLFDWLAHRDCPKPTYSPLRYWTPGPARVSDCVHGPRLSSHAPNTHPDIPPTFITLEYPCRAAEPAATLIPPPPER
jgi:hypothetical protein